VLEREPGLEGVPNQAGAVVRPALRAVAVEVDEYRIVDAVGVDVGDDRRCRERFGYSGRWSSKLSSWSVEIGEKFQVRGIVCPAAMIA